MSTNRKHRKILEKPKIAQLRGDEALGRMGFGVAVRADSRVSTQCHRFYYVSAIRGCVMGGSVCFGAFHFVVYCLLSIIYAI